MSWLDKIPFSTLIIITILLGLAPFSPQPHLVEKLQMLFAGTLSKPIDIVDLFLHGAPLLLLIMKTVRHYMHRSSARD